MLGSPLVPGVLMCINQGRVWGWSECRSVRYICREPKQLNDLLVKTQWHNPSARELASMYIHRRRQKPLGDVHILPSSSDSAICVILYQEGKNTLPLLWFFIYVSGGVASKTQRSSVLITFSLISSSFFYFQRCAFAHHHVNVNFSRCVGEWGTWLSAMESIFGKHLLFWCYMIISSNIKTKSRCTY